MAVDNSRQVDAGGEDLIVRDIYLNSSAPGGAGTKVTASGVYTGPVSGSITGALAPPSGTTTVPPLKLTSGTNLTNATPGAIEFDGAAYYATVQSSTRQMLDAEQFVISQSDLTYSNTVMSSNLGVAVFSTTANGAVTLPVGQFAFEGQYYITDNNSGTAHAYQTKFGGTAGLSSGTYLANGVAQAGSSASSFGVTVWVNTPSTGVAVTNTVGSATGNAMISISGVLTVSSGGGGTLIPQICSSASLSSGSGTYTVKTGSFFRIWQMGAASTGTVGNWS